MTGRKPPFDCAIGPEPETVQNIFSGDSVTIPADAVAIYDVIIGSSMMAEKSTSTKVQAELYKEVRAGIDWFIQNEPRAYMVLLD
jgi:hypothetical protein|tara:strand:+ start:1300 stop:1554 length:255 start_codon:yes stop_codon:yes gene_type:complete